MDSVAVELAQPRRLHRNRAHPAADLRVGGDVLVLTLASLAALAGPSTTLDALDRLEEVIELRLEDGRLSRDEVLPAILVSTKPIYEVSDGPFQARALDVLTKTFGNRGIRVCEACMAPRTFVENGELVMQTGPIGLDEVTRLDDQFRGEAQPARTGIWIDENRLGVSIRIVDLSTARVIIAKNVDATFEEERGKRRRYRLAAEYERRARGDSLTQAFVDIAVLPEQHIALDWTDQWGKTNRNLTGVTITVVDPIVGLGFSHYRATPLANTLIGGRFVVSLPNVLGRVLDQEGDFDLGDPLLTAVAVVRVPLWRSNYGVVATASTNGTFAVGVSFMNIQLLPIIP